MASELYEKIGQPQAVQSTNPKEAALSLMKQQGFQISEGCENDPNALLQMVLQSGKIYQNRLPMARNIIANFMGRR